MSENKLGTIGLVHGFGHRAEHWDKLRPKLEARGLDTIAVDLPPDEPEPTFAGYAQVAAEAFKPATRNGGRLTVVTHSMGSGLLPDLVKIMGVDKFRGAYHISGSIGASGNSQPEDLPTTVLPRIPKQRNTKEYCDATHQLTNDKIVLDPSQIRRLLFEDCDPEDFIWALELMRLQTKPKIDPPLEAYKIDGLQQTYLLGEDDAIRDEDYVREKIIGELGMKLIMMPGGHSPAIARPDELADIIEREVRNDLALEDTAAMQMPFYGTAYPWAKLA